ncbi:hypothetical protein ACJMK2_009607 [Sinanodonta woodiana]|uniref:Fe2OG dioxygenase domain-containing protein n=1 Tax=Sinanodonta woodiana TaxID=1069815 RepID=A0ABD3VCS1_SINWO
MQSHMEIAESILLCLFVLVLVDNDAKIQAEHTATEKDATCIQQNNCEWERTLDGHSEIDHDQVTNGEMEEGDEENVDKYLSGFARFATSEVKTDDTGQPRFPEVEDSMSASYEYAPLPRRDPGKVGDTQEIEYSPGQVLKLITRAVQPPVFEIPEFLTSEECSIIIQTANNLGLKRSGVFGGDLEEELKTKDIADVSRISNQTWLTMAELGDLGASLTKRVASVTELPTAVIQRSEKLQVVSYSEGGHYHAHLDSSDHHASNDDKAPSDTPCCFQTNCAGVVNTPKWNTCCRLCRYITVMYYLSDVPAGGETAFPLADLSEEKYQAFLEDEDHDWSNLSYFCYNASLIVRPKKGTAIMWYNHHVDPETGYLGRSDQRSFHGGCDILKGSKWIANTWISAPPYYDRLKPSLHFNGREH